MWFAAGKGKSVAALVFSDVDSERFAVTLGFFDQLFRHVVMMNVDGLVLHCYFFLALCRWLIASAYFPNTPLFSSSIKYLRSISSCGLTDLARGSLWAISSKVACSADSRISRRCSRAGISD